MSWIRTVGLIAIVALNVLAAGEPKASAVTRFSQSPFDCGSLPGDAAGLCRALEIGQCSLAVSESDRWLCRGVTTGQCSVVQDEGQRWLCRGVTTTQCSNVPEEADRRLCRAVVTGDCETLAAFGQGALCLAMARATGRVPSL